MPALEQVLKGRRILLTGSTGFLGKVFLAILLRWHPEIERVYLLIRGDRRSSVGRFRREILDSPVFAPLREHLGEKFDRYIEEKIVVVPGDITNQGLLAEEAKPFKPGSLDAVVHSAGLVNFEASLEKAIEVNTTGVANVIEFCGKVGAAMMHVSTCYAAGSDLIAQHIGNTDNAGSSAVAVTHNAGRTWQRVTFAVPAQVPGGMQGDSFLTIGQIQCPQADACVATGVSDQGSTATPIYTNHG